MAKVPMQFFILLIGVMVFVFYQFQAPPLFFNPVETERIKASRYAEEYGRLETEYREHVSEQSAVVREYLDVREKGTDEDLARANDALLAAEKGASRLRTSAAELVAANNGNANDTNYLFLAFVMQYLPVGVVGLIFACIFAASMSSTSGELSALATSSVVDIYKRHVRGDADQRHYLFVSRIAMASWGVYGILFAQYASGLGSLIEAVNILGSLFYGTMLGVFLLAFYVKFVTGTPVFVGAIVSEVLVISLFLSERAGLVSVAWLWYPVIGCAVVVLAALLIQVIGFQKTEPGNAQAT
jgi:Na+(H+)/acetate symporter ActP